MLNSKGFGGSFKINELKGHFMMYKDINLETFEKNEHNFKESQMWNRKTNKMDEIMQNMYKFCQNQSIIEKKFTTYEDMLYLSSLYKLGENTHDIAKTFPFVHHIDEHPKKNELRKSLYSHFSILRYYYMNQLIEANIEECVYINLSANSLIH